MKWLSIIASIAVIALAGALFVPSLAAQQQILAGSAAGAGLLSLIAALLRRDQAPVEPVRAASLPTATGQPRAEADVITFLGLLQEKGRFVDFLMDDITPYDDAQVGAAARVVHQGCQAVLKEHMQVEPVSPEVEGTLLTLPEGYSAADYRLLGNVTGAAPFTGTLVHKGWQASKVKLPTVIATGYELPNIAPAQVELS